MKVGFFSAKSFDPLYFNLPNCKHTFLFFPEPLSLTSLHKAKDCQAVCCFVTDCLDAQVIAKLAEQGIQVIALRSAGYDHVDLQAAKSASVMVVRVPKYSPESVAEFAVALILTLSRNILTAYLEGLTDNFSLEGLMGFNLYQKTVGIIGTGNIGTAFAKIMHGFGCHLLAYDPIPNDICRDLGVNYVDKETLLKQSDIVSLHCPLNETSYHLLNNETFSLMKKGAMIINTGRGGLCDTQALIDALDSGQIAFAGLDVYEKEKGLFFIDHHKGPAVKDEQFIKLQSKPNVLITPHIAFFTQEAVENIAKTTIENLTAFGHGKIMNQVL